MTYRPTADFFLGMNYGDTSKALDACDRSIEFHLSSPQTEEVKIRLKFLEQCKITLASPRHPCDTGCKETQTQETKP